MSGPDDFLSGTSGQVHGVRATTRALLADTICDTVALARLEPWRLRRAAEHGPRRRVLALGIEHDHTPNILAAARAELARSRHDVVFAGATVGGRGKFQNLNTLLDGHRADGYDWLVLVDDDVALPPRFLDAFIFLAERFDLALAQPAHRWGSHAAWAVTRRRPGSVVRETAFVEIGPVCALRAVTFAQLLPFPPLRTGWGLDAHWSAVAREHGWRLGIVDATPIRHHLRRIAATYDRASAIAEARAFLDGRPYTSASEAQRTLAEHRGWR
ncbi:MAG: hypothetical protein ACR2NR_17985 [Solirubrobacteraceae bacterium]